LHARFVLVCAEWVQTEATLSAPSRLHALKSAFVRHWFFFVGMEPVTL